MKRLYLAGQSRNHEMVSALANLVSTRNKAIEWTYPWWTLMDDYHALNDENDPNTVERLKRLKEAAENDTRGVATADGVVLLYRPAIAARGMWTELGIALALNKPVLLLTLEEGKVGLESFGYQALNTLEHNVFLSQVKLRNHFYHSEQAPEGNLSEWEWLISTWALGL